MEEIENNYLGTPSNWILQNSGRSDPKMLTRSSQEKVEVPCFGTLLK